MLRSQILGVGSYVPCRIVKNTELESLMDTSDDWITKRTGIRERRWASDEESTSDLGVKASLAALENTGVDKSEIDCLIFGTISPDHDFPGTGCFIQAKLGIPGIPAIDVRGQCSGFIYSMSIADQFIRSGMYRKVLVIGAEVHSRGLDKTTSGRDVSVIFGDGAGAVILGAIEMKDAKKDSYIYSSHLHADGRFAKELWMPAPGFAMAPDCRINAAMLEQGLHYPQMNGKKVFVHAVEKMGEVLSEALKANGLEIPDIDLFFFHQANLRINEAVTEAMKIPSDKVFNTIQKYGNTTAATIPLGMDEARKAGRLKRGNLVAAVAFGSGFTWAASIFRY